jgi:hypothetical protein
MVFLLDHELVVKWDTAWAASKVGWKEPDSAEKSVFEMAASMAAKWELWLAVW